MYSIVANEGPGQGKGYYVHNGVGAGHQRKAADAMADGEYTLIVDDIDLDNDTAVDQQTVLGILPDGSTAYAEVRLGSISVTTAPEGGSDGEALRLQTDSNDGRLRLTTVFDQDQYLALGDLDQLSFNFYVEESSTDIHAPVIRLLIDADGDLATTNDRGELVFEWAYQDMGNVPEGEWVAANLSGDDWVAWQRANGTNFDFGDGLASLSDWADADGHSATGGLTFDEDSLVLGYSIAYGSGNGTGVMYVDDVKVAGVTYDFGTDSFF